MPLRQIECPQCDADLVVKRGGVCPNCGAASGEHVARVRAREKRIEQIVAVVATVLVVGVAVVTSGATLLEGIAALRDRRRRDVLPRAPHFRLNVRLFSSLQILTFGQLSERPFSFGRPKPECTVKSFSPWTFLAFLFSKIVQPISADCVLLAHHVSCSKLSRNGSLASFNALSIR